MPPQFPDIRSVGFSNMSIIENTEICAHSAESVFHKSNMSERALESTSPTNRERQQNSHLIRDLWSKCHPGAWARGETETFVLFEGLKQRWIFSCLQTDSPNPRQETRRPDFPRFLWKKDRKKKRSVKIWHERREKTVWCVYLGYICTLTGEIPSYSILMCVSEKQRPE